VHCAIAWANINLFDFNNRLLSDKVSLKLWPMPPGLDDLLHPIGLPGTDITAALLHIAPSGWQVLSV